MSEKRFECVFKEHETKNSWSMIKDNQLDKSLYIKDVVDLLNGQDKEIGLLRLELDTHKHPLWSTREAERKNNKLVDSLADEVKKNGLLHEEINQLRIENMRLKKKRVVNGDMIQDDEFVLRLRKLLDNDGKEVDEIKIWIDTDNGLFEINSVTEQTGTDCNGKLVRQVFIETA